MSSFVPDGYLPIDEAFARAMKRWFADQISKKWSTTELNDSKIFQRRMIPCVALSCKPAHTKVRVKPLCPN